MKILSAPQIREFDSYTIQNEPISSIDLMERASGKVIEWLLENGFKGRDFKIFCGPGNNGGDGLAVARMLAQNGFQIEVFIVKAQRYSTDFSVNLERIKGDFNPHFLESEKDFPEIKTEDVVLDALFGSGLNKPLSGSFASLVQYLNNKSDSIISIDIASGLFCDQFSTGNTIIKPAYTLTFQAPKLAMLLPSNAEYVGEMEILDIGLSREFMEKVSTDYFFSDAPSVFPLVKRRSKFSHKGTFGKTLIIAGNYGTIGASLLTSKAAYRSGAGLVYAYIPKCGYQVMQTLLPEALTWTDQNEFSITSLPEELEIFDAIGIGPGVSEQEEMVSVLESLFKKFRKPIVIDASALNVISRNKELLKQIPEKSILTPHPKEFERLVGKFENDFERLEKLKAFSVEIKSFVVFKGANTAISTPEGEIYFNSTGNPGMATGGSGDVLTGIITGLLAQKYSPKEAAILGVYLHGFAGDKASKRTGMAPLLATDIIEGIKDFYLETEKS